MKFDEKALARRERMMEQRRLKEQNQALAACLRKLSVAVAREFEITTDDGTAIGQAQAKSIALLAALDKGKETV